MPLSTACPPLDELLDGGLEEDAITLVFGEGGSGKTNLALQLCREVTAAGRKVAYVDTEGVSPRRMEQVFAGVLGDGAVADEDVDVAQETADRGPDQEDKAGAGDPDPDAAAGDPLGATADVPPAAPIGVDAVGAGAPAVQGDPVQTHARPGAPTLDELQDRLLFFQPYNILEQEKMVHKTALLPGLGLIVVDSINMHYRLHIDDPDKEKEAGRSLYKQLHHLTTYARKNRVPVLITGQVYGGEDTTQPFARRVMEHLVKALVRFEKRPDGSRRATVLKHRSIEDGRQARFRIGMHGLEEP